MHIQKILFPMIAVFALLAPLHAQAAAKPPELVASIHAPMPLGTATLNKFMMHIYDVSLWGDHGAHTPPYAISITYVLDFDGAELAERTRDEMKRVSDLPDATLKNYEKQLAKLWPDVDEGDRLTAIALPDGSTVFYHNGRKLGAIADPQFTAAFFGIWLSPKTSEPELRAQLLHLNSAN